MRAAAFTILVIAIIYLGGVLVSLSWNPCAWSLWVQVVAGIMAICNAAFVAFAFLAFRGIFDDENEN